MELIDKDKVVAEIERRKKEAESNWGGYKSYDEHRCDSCIVGFYEEFLEIINTLEVKEVDLEKEIQDHIRECLDVKFPTTDIELIKKDVAYTSRKFFELGLKAKGE